MESDSSDDRSRRKHERSWFSFPCTLTLETGRKLHGKSRDVSISGLFLEVKEAACESGEAGRLQIEAPGLGGRTFSCRVAHVTPYGLGLHLHRTAENFAPLVTQALFGDTMTRLGGHAPEWSKIRLGIELPGHAPMTGAIASLSRNMCAICVPQDLAGRLRVNSTLKLRLFSRGDDTPIIVPGRVTSSAGRCQIEERTTTDRAQFQILFDTTFNAETSGLTRLLRQVHEKRLGDIMQSRLKAGASLSGPDQRPAFDRSKAQRDIDRFFAHKRKPGA
ncbi:MAG: PilZ domain-containing protein [Magnetococcales bacterium]|nr:PilZ domain-containing protein [Magnetococcales bacterium]MBF0156587.1 PilZ domain-containing protein [Magnetococcales bacterium]